MKHALLSLLLAAALMIPGCGEPLPEADFTFITSAAHNDWDPQRMSWVHDIRLARCLYEPLVSLDFSDLSIHPAVAERWEVSEDGRTYTFHLREDARWSDGQPVTAGDFLFAWRRAMLPDLAADYTQLMFHIKGAQAFFEFRQEQFDEHAGRSAKKGVSRGQALWARAMSEFRYTVGLAAPDDRTLVVTLESPTPFFLELCAFATFMPAPRHVLEPDRQFHPDTHRLQTDAAYWSDPARLVTNGPYQLAQRNFREGAYLTANPHYWNRAAMKNDSIKELIIGSAQAALGVYENGQADLYVDVPTGSSLAADLAAQSRADVHAQPMAGVYFYDYNCLPTLPGGADNPLYDARVRRALSMAINRQAIVSRVTRLNEPIARSYVPPGALPNYQPPVEEGVTFDPEAARQLLADAGYPQGRGLTGLSILYNTDSAHERIAQAVQQMWREHLGVSVALQPMESKAFRERLKSQNYTIARASWFGDYPDPTTWLQKMTTNDGNNDCKWSNAEFDALLAQAALESDPTQRRDLLRQAEAILLHEQPMALLFQYTNVYLFDPARVHGLQPNAWGRWRFQSVSVGEGR